MEEMINISKERYEELLQSEKELNALYSCGVDNWEGYEEAMEALSEGGEDD